MESKRREARGCPVDGLETWCAISSGDGRRGEQGEMVDDSSGLWDWGSVCMRMLQDALFGLVSSLSRTRHAK